jgi:hypothetical protein
LDYDGFQQGVKGWEISDIFVDSRVSFLHCTVLLPSLRDGELDLGHNTSAELSDTWQHSGIGWRRYAKFGW